jgi:Zn-dependent protease
MSHGYAALKLGDPTARNLGRLTLNPLKHIDPIGFVCMILFHFGWANPVPINSRYFKNPRRDMALSALAGPLSNVLLAAIFTGILRLLLLLCSTVMTDDLSLILYAGTQGGAYTLSFGGTILSILVYMCYLGIIINLGFAIFNLIPIPPLDGSRIFYVFLPPKWYFAIMKYERVIMLVMLLLLCSGTLSLPIDHAVKFISNGLFYLTGMGTSTDTFFNLRLIIYHINSLL